MRIFRFFVRLSGGMAVLIAVVSMKRNAGLDSNRMAVTAPPHGPDIHLPSK